MDKFVIRVSRKSSQSDGSNADEPSTSSKRPRLDKDPEASTRSEVTERMRLYKDNLRYNPEWKKKWPWIKYKVGDMFCSVCKKYGKPPVQARGAWVQHPVANWVKATELLNKHEKSEWHKVAFEKHASRGCSKTWRYITKDGQSQ